MKKVLSNILFGIVICVFGYLSIANILHVIYLNKYDTFDFDSKVITNINENISKLESNIDKVSKLDTSVFTEEELNKIKEILSNEMENIKKSELLTYKGKQKFYLRDLLEIDLSTQLPWTGNINILEILTEHDNSINNYLEIYKHQLISAAYNKEETFLKVREAYKYNTLDSYNAILIEPQNIGINARVYDLNYYVVRENFIANLVLRIGGALGE